jgi:uncharacterized membrane protein
MRGEMHHMLTLYGLVMTSLIAAVYSLFSFAISLRYKHAVDLTIRALRLLLFSYCVLGEG